MAKTSADIIHTITLGWRCTTSFGDNHFWKSNTFAKMAGSSCGKIVYKVNLINAPDNPRCPHCEWKREHRQDMKPFVERS